MKTTVKLLLTTLLLVVVFTSCNRRERPINSQKINFQSAEAQFFGDPARINIDFYDLYLFDSKLTSNPNGDGVFIYLQLNSDITSANEILPGNYLENNSNGPKMYTFEAGQWRSDNQGDYVVGSYIAEYSGNQTIVNPISRGNLNVKRNGQSYVIQGVVTADGKTYDVYYGGMIPMIDMVVPLPETLTHGEIWYYGNHTGGNGNTVKLYTVRLGADDVKISNFAGSGDAMQIDLYVPLNNSPLTIIPDGEYPIMVDNVKPYTAGDGYFDSNDQADYGTWYYTSDALSINQGFVRVTYLDGSYYRLDFNFVDDYYRYNFVGQYEGELAFVNKTSSPIAVRQQAPRLDVGNSRMDRVDNRFERGRMSQDRELLDKQRVLRNSNTIGKSIRKDR